MTIINIAGFKGSYPKASNKLLDQAMATVAENCVMDRGRIEPLPGVGASVEVATGAKTIHKANNNWHVWTNPVTVAPDLASNSNATCVFTGEEYPKQLRSQGSIAEQIRRLGIIAPTSAPSVSMAGTPGDTVLRSVSYVYTRMESYAGGRVIESAPSPPTDVTDQMEGETATVSGLTTTGAGTGTEVTHYRIYRLNAGDYGAEFQYVDQIEISSSSYIDNVDDEDLGEVLPTADWNAPSTCLQGIIASSNGLFFGFYDNEIYVSPPYVPYAFPEKWMLKTSHDLVGLGHSGNVVFGLTEANPYIIVGQEPASLSMERLPFPQACLSARSIANIPGGVIYASPDGLFSLSEAGAGEVLTQNILSKSQWNNLLGTDYLPDLIGFVYDGAYLGFSGSKGFKFNLGEDNHGIETFSLTGTVTHGEYVAEDDLLYLALDGQIIPWKEGADSSFTWASKTFEFSSAQIFTCAVATGEFNSESPLALTITVDGVTKTVSFVKPGKVERLQGFRGREIVLSISGTKAIDRFAIATSAREILNV